MGQRVQPGASQRAGNSCPLHFPVDFMTWIQSLRGLWQVTDLWPLRVQKPQARLLRLLALNLISCTWGC